MEKAAFSHIGLTCADPERVEKFYTRYFGFKRARVYAPGPGQVVMIKSGNFYLELFKAAEKSPVPPAKGAGPDYPGWKHICFLVADLDAKLKELGNAVKITKGPVDMGGLIPGMKVCWVADPEGNIVELNQGYVDEC
ncbi:MAG: VOC family protein [Elusimicrobia bacterium]|nr:VOC family protein [Elusimicrobiota bacterium]